MTDDADLSRRLTAAVRAVDGVTGVYAAQPVLEAAAVAIVERLRLEAPGMLVDVDRADGAVRVAVHVATAADRPAADVIRAVGERVRDLVAAEPDGDGTVLVHVTGRLVEDAVAAGPS
ncbi:hypothetical protein CMsap09_01660 [Clavibacter michiganensis]|uniref:Asp23/Gls24 family envelope stress response protein n=1 Tax=Clavibacter michiganensis TaxID=28447 RepID=A0A251XQ43_9MICO|nr:hypothetical protein CMsap09_01660 [Clavibacter michiganensis]